MTTNNTRAMRRQTAQSRFSPSPIKRQAASRISTGVPRKAPLEDNSADLLNQRDSLKNALPATLPRNLWDKENSPVKRPAILVDCLNKGSGVKVPLAML